METEKHGHILTSDGTLHLQVACLDRAEKGVIHVNAVRMDRGFPCGHRALLFWSPRRSSGGAFTKRSEVQGRSLLAQTFTKQMEHATNRRYLCGQGRPRLGDQSRVGCKAR